MTPEECDAWRKAAERMFVPYNAELGIHEQAEGFTTHEAGISQRPGRINIPDASLSLFRPLPKQVVKQPDLVLAMQLCGDAFTAEEKARNFAYYEQITVRDFIAFRLYPGCACGRDRTCPACARLAVEAALIDLDDLEHNVRDGLHFASLAGTWTATGCGLRRHARHADTSPFAPRFPHGLAGFLRHRAPGMPLRIVIDARPLRL